jgi:hypothetical protein
MASYYSYTTTPSYTCTYVTVWSALITVIFLYSCSTTKYFYNYLLDMDSHAVYQCTIHYYMLPRKSPRFITHSVSYYVCILMRSSFNLCMSLSASPLRVNQSPQVNLFSRSTNFVCFIYLFHTHHVFVS